MNKQIFVNLPVKDIARSRAFFTALGYTFNPQFSDDNALCMIINEDHIYAMLLQEQYFQTFTAKAIADSRTTTEVLLALSCDSRAEVDDQVAKAVAAGGQSTEEPKDYGFMYYRTFQDPDGHNWELIFMEPGAEPPQA